MKVTTIAIAAAIGLVAGTALAKLPPPSDEAKAKAAEAAAKSAHAGKVEAYQLCKSMDRAAELYMKEQKAKGKEVKPSETKPCVDPGAFQAAAAPAPAPAAAPAAAAAKK